MKNHMWWQTILVLESMKAFPNQKERLSMTTCGLLVRPYTMLALIIQGNIWWHSNQTWPLPSLTYLPIPSSNSIKLWRLTKNCSLCNILFLATMPHLVAGAPCQDFCASLAFKSLVFLASMATWMITLVGTLLTISSGIMASFVPDDKFNSYFFWNWSSVLLKAVNRSTVKSWK